MSSNCKRHGPRKGSAAADEAGVGRIPTAPTE